MRWAACCRVVSLGACLGAALMAGGCSLSFPMASLFGNDDMPTGSIAKTEPATAAVPAGAALADDGLSPKPVILARLAPELDLEDWRRARSALGVALDPQGNGAPAAWDNPQSRRNGRFVPAGQPYVVADEICRAFQADIAGPSLSRALEGDACRPSGGEWRLKDLRARQKPV